MSSPLSQDWTREIVEIVTINQSVLINSHDEHIVSSLVVVFICLLQCFDFTIVPIWQVTLFKSFIMKENNDVENFLICSRVAPLLTLTSRPSIVAIKLNKQFQIFALHVQNVKLY